MPRPINEMSSWSHSVHHSRLSEEDWQATRQLTQLQTQLMRTQDDYLASVSRDIGRRISDDRHELFVVCDPGEALLQQFQLLTPDLIAVHDIASDSSRRLLAGLAAATGKKVQKLVIRRQGHGSSLATIEFAEIPGAQGQMLRVYSTLIDADTRQREEMTLALLAHSRLAVVMIGDLPPHALGAALDPLRGQMAVGPWPNRNLLLVPLGSSSRLADLAGRVAGQSGVSVRLTPQAVRPADAWAYISTAWDRLRDGGSIGAMSIPATNPLQPKQPALAPTPPAAAQVVPLPTQRNPVSAPAAPLPMKPMPATGSARDAAESPWDRYVRDCADIKGLLSCAIFEQGTQNILAHAGSQPVPTMLAAQGVPLITAMNDAARALGLRPGQPDAAISYAAHHVLLHPIRGHPGAVLCAVMDSHTANLTLARMRIGRLDEYLEV